MPDTLTPMRYLRWPRLLLDSGISDDLLMPAEEEIRVDEFAQDGHLIVRASIPGIDPEKDVQITVSDGTLNIRAERRKETKVSRKDYLREEMHYGSFSRTLPLPRGVKDKDVKATYTNGVLEVTLPIGDEAAKSIPVTVTK